MTRQSAVLGAGIGGVSGRAGRVAGVEAGPVPPVETMVPAGRGLVLRIAMWWVRRVAALGAPTELR